MQRITLHLQDDLAREIRLAAQEAGQTLSTWVSRAARARLFEAARPASEAKQEAPAKRKTKP